MPRRHGRPRHRSSKRAAPYDQPLNPSPATPVPSTETVETDETRHLENLRIALRAAAPELFVRMVLPRTEPAYLHVSNPVGAGQFAEAITVQPGDRPGESWFAWSWQERITPTTAPKIAAQMVAKVLAVGEQDKW